MFLQKRGAWIELHRLKIATINSEKFGDSLLDGGSVCLHPWPKPKIHRSFDLSSPQRLHRKNATVVNKDNSQCVEDGSTISSPHPKPEAVDDKNRNILVF
jgi:hypothetical protein